VRLTVRALARFVGPGFNSAPDRDTFPGSFDLHDVADHGDAKPSWE